MTIKIHTLINDYHPSLRFTMEEEKDGKLPVLDMLIIRDGVSLSSTWYSKPTSTGLPSLKPAIDHCFRSHFVYQITCSRCNAWVMLWAHG